jgi:low temperature requirement protein LtrA
MFAGMLGVIGLSLTLGSAFSPQGDMPFIVCCVVVRTVLALLYVRAAYYVPLARSYCIPFVIGVGGSSCILLGSMVVDAPYRYALWALAFALELATPFLNLRATRSVPIDRSHIPERLGLFTIIVLGEVIFGVVDGLSTPDRDGVVIATGTIALVIGFGFWWIYFDLVGRRPPRNGGPLVTWMLSHLPITLSIAAAGAAMVSLIGHAGDDRTPAGTAWLLAGAVALGLVALIFTEQALVDAERLDAVYRPLRIALAAGAAAALAAGWARPAPWLFGLALVVILSLLWIYAASRFLRTDAWST